MVNEPLQQFIHETVLPESNCFTDPHRVVLPFAGLLVLCITKEAYSVIKWLPQTVKSWSQMSAEEMACVLSLVKVVNACPVCQKKVAEGGTGTIDAKKSFDCKSCGMAYYCSRRCNRIAYHDHKKVCALLNLARKHIVANPINC